MPETPAPPSARADAERRLGVVDVLLYGVLVLIWGGSFLAIEFQLGSVPAEVSVLWRYVLAAGSLFLFCLATGQRLRGFGLRDHGLFVLFGLFFFSLNYVLIYRAQLELTSGLAAIIFTMALFFATLNARLFLKTPLSLRVILGGAIGIAGLVVLLRGSIFSSDVDAGTLAGASYMLGAAYVVSLGTVITSILSRRKVPGLSANAWGMVYGLAFNLAWVLILGRDLAFEWTSAYVLSLLYLAFPASVVGFVLYYVVVLRIGAARASYFTLMSPMVAIAISTVVEGLPVTLSLALGVGAVLAGNYVAVRPGRR